MFSVLFFIVRTETYDSYWTLTLHHNLTEFLAVRARSKETHKKFNNFNKDRNAMNELKMWKRKKNIFECGFVLFDFRYKYIVCDKASPHLSFIDDEKWQEYEVPHSW